MLRSHPTTAVSRLHNNLKDMLLPLPSELSNKAFARFAGRTSLRVRAQHTFGSRRARRGSPVSRSHYQPPAPLHPLLEAVQVSDERHEPVLSHGRSLELRLERQHLPPPHRPRLLVGPLLLPGLRLPLLPGGLHELRRRPCPPRRPGTSPGGCRPRARHASWRRGSPLSRAPSVVGLSPGDFVGLLATLPQELERPEDAVGGDALPEPAGRQENLPRTNRRVWTGRPGSTTAGGAPGARGSRGLKRTRAS